MRILVAIALLIFAIGCTPSEHEKTVRVTSHEQLSSLVGKRVELIGVVSEDTKCPYVHGVDLWELESYRGKTVRVRGRLNQQVVTREQLDEDEKQTDMVANRGAGTFYSLDKMTFEVIASTDSKTP